MLGPQGVKGVIAFYPPIDFTKPLEAPEKCLIGGIKLPLFARKLFDNSYILPSQDKADPRLSPIFAPTESFPKRVYLVCGNADVLHDPAEKLVQRLKEAGHNGAEFVGLAYMGHGFDLVSTEGSEAEAKKHQVYDGAVDLINKAIGEQ